MKAKYWLRKLATPIFAILWMVGYILVLMYYNSIQLLMIAILLIGVLITTKIYPKKTVYCKCGDKWKKKAIFNETLSSEKKPDKKGDIKVVFYHKFNVQCTCPSCKSTSTYEVPANGGYEIKHSNGKVESHKIKHTLYIQNKSIINS